MSEEERYRAGCSIGAGIGGLPGIESESLVLDRKGPSRVSPHFVHGRLINLISGQVSIKYGLMGPNHAVVTACSTGAHSIGDAARMIRDDGRFEGRQVIPADWLRRSLEPRARSPYSGMGYGYGWFITRLAGERAVYARGYGGQMLYILPDLALTVAITSDPTRPARTAGHVGDLNRLVAQQIVPAVRA